MRRQAEVVAWSALAIFISWKISLELWKFRLCDILEKWEDPYRAHHVHQQLKMDYDLVQSR